MPLLPTSGPILKGDKLKYKILVLDRSAPALNQALVSMLSKEGFRVITYSGHPEALLRLGELELDLIILGEGLPVDSFDACWQLRQAVDIPIVMLGKVPRATGWVKAVENGADCYLVKPFHYSEVVARIKAILRRRDWSLVEG